MLTEIVFFDKPSAGFAWRWGLLESYFLLTVLASLGQAAGVLLVVGGRYRAGGWLQLVSSGIQVWKVDGIPGIVGGMRALRCVQPAHT